MAVVLFGFMGGALALCIVAIPLWLALSDRFLGTDFYGLDEDKS